jgi:hypothetical protein
VSVSYGTGDRGKATRLHAEIVRARGRCERCGSSSGQLQCAHIVRRIHAHTRTDLTNAWCLCASCHRKVDADPWIFRELVDATIGEGDWRRLRLKAEVGVRVKFDWAAEVDRLKLIAADLKRLGEAGEYP